MVRDLGPSKLYLSKCHWDLFGILTLESLNLGGVFVSSFVIIRKRLG